MLRIASSRTVRSPLFLRKPKLASAPRRASSSKTQESEPKQREHKNGENGSKLEPKKKKTMAQLDEEIRSAMEGISGDGGEAGMELEDGKPVPMRRGVRENMFRYI